MKRIFSFLAVASLYFIICARYSYSQMQSDISDTYWRVVKPLPSSHDIDMKQCLLGLSKDSVIVNFIQNTGTWKFRVDSIYFTGVDASAFSVVSSFPVYTLEAGQNKATEFRFKPSRVGTHTAEIVIITQAETLHQTIRGEGVQPVLEIVNSIIDFGKKNVGESKDTIQVVTIKNIGSMALSIKSTNHNKPNDYDFTTQLGGGSFIIPAGEEHKMNLRFTPSDLGRTSGTLEFHYDGVGSPAIVQLFGEGIQPVLEIINSNIDFGEVLLGSDTTKLQEVTIANTGNGILRIDDIKITNPEFEKLSGSNQFDLSPLDTVKLDLKFTPSKLGNCNADLEFYHNLSTAPAVVQLTGIGIVNNVAASVSFSVDSFSAYAGEIIEVPIILNSSSNIHEANISSFTVDLFFNPTLLYPHGYTSEKIDNKTSKITLENLPVNISIGEALTNIKLTAALGNSPGCDLTLSNAKAEGGNAEITVHNGKFNLLGICEEGGTRLINPDKITELMKISPNPSSGKVTIEINLVEKGCTALKLFDYEGRLLEERNMTDQIGKIMLELNTQNYESGVYFLHLETPTVITKEKLIIKK